MVLASFLSSGNMPLSPDQSDSVAKLMDLGVTLDQALLALVKESWDLSAAADACIDHVYTVTARKRPTVRKCELCDYWTGGYFESVLRGLRSRAR